MQEIPDIKHQGFIAGFELLFNQVIKLIKLR